MQVTYTYKVAKLAELDVLVELVQEFYEFEQISFNELIHQNALKTLIENESLGRVWLIYWEEIVIGYVAIAFDYSIELGGRIACLDEIYLRENYRGRGIGTETLEFVEKACLDFNINSIYLEVERDNLKAQQFYRKIGYRDRNYYLMIKHTKKY